MRIVFRPTTYARISLGISPLTEAVLSFRELIGYQSSPALGPWRRQAWRAVQGLDLAPLRILITRRDLADILSPPPTSSTTPDIRSQLDDLVAVPQDWLRRDIRRLYGRSVPAAAAEYVRSPRAALHRLADTVDRYWSVVIAPWWPRLSAVLETDLLYRARAVTRCTVQDMVNDMHPEMAATDDAVVFHPKLAPPHHRDVPVGPHGIVFVASAFVTGKPMVNSEERDRTAIFYGARGLGNVTGPTGKRPVDALAVLLSRRRADLVRAIRRPATPSELARRLGVTASAISQQLAQLAAAGLASRHQIGRRAYYQLTDRGRDVLDLLDPA